jgi:drug/metabolite transporter (DMT)-like permease
MSDAADVTSRAWILFGAVALVWGTPYLFIKLAVDDGVPPAFVAWTRVAIAAVLLLPVAWRLGALRGLRARLGPLLAFSLCEIAIPFPLIAAGEQHVSSSLAAILVAALPLMIAVLAVRFDADERVTGARLVGLVIGFAGVVVLLGIDVAGRTAELVGAALVLVATAGYAAGPMIVKRHLADRDPLGPVAVAMGMSTVMLAPAAAVSLPAAAPTETATASILVLGVLCSAVAFLLYFALIAAIGPSRASVITYLNPAVAVALGVTLLDERVGAGAVAGLLLILAGSWLSTDGRLPPGLAGALTRRPGAAGSPAA